MSWRVGLAALITYLGGSAFPVCAQSLEIAPFGGYRFGGDFFALVSEHPVDVDGAPAVGFVLNVPVSMGLQFEALVTHQNAQVRVPAGPVDPATRWRMSVDHVQAGGLQELSDGRVRPFLTGMLGLTRYAAEGDSEIRFAVGAGGGVKLFPLANLGLRLDARLNATFVDAAARFLACANGVCLSALHVDVVWQAEFTAGLVVRLR
jgi:hypothetical protein